MFARVLRSRISVTVVAAAALMLLAVAPVQAETLKVLMFGNSLSSGVKRSLTKLFKNSGVRVKVKAKTRNGAELEDHLRSRATAKIIAAKNWDYIVLQEQSAGMLNYRYEFVRQFDDLIRPTGATPLLFMTWRDRGSDLSLYDRLLTDRSGGFLPIAEEIGAPVAPIGWAFRNGVIDDPNIDLWANDGHHSSTAGRYLSAAVLYSVIAQRSPEGLSGERGLGDVECGYLEWLAWETVVGEWNRFQLELAVR